MSCGKPAEECLVQSGVEALAAITDMVNSDRALLRDRDIVLSVQALRRVMEERAAQQRDPNKANDATEIARQLMVAQGLLDSAPQDSGREPEPQTVSVPGQSSSEGLAQACQQGEIPAELLAQHSHYFDAEDLAGMTWTTRPASLTGTDEPFMVVMRVEAGANTEDVVDALNYVLGGSFDHHRNGEYCAAAIDNRTFIFEADAAYTSHSHGDYEAALFRAFWEMRGGTPPYTLGSRAWQRGEAVITTNDGRSIRAKGPGEQVWEGFPQPEGVHFAIAARSDDTTGASLEYQPTELYHTQRGYSSRRRKGIKKQLRDLRLHNSRTFMSVSRDLLGAEVATQDGDTISLRYETRAYADNNRRMRVAESHIIRRAANDPEFRQRMFTKLHEALRS